MLVLERDPETGWPSHWYISAVLDCRHDNLKERAKPFLGKRLLFAYCGTDDDGHWEWWAAAKDTGWFPHKDLRDIEVSTFEDYMAAAYGDRK